MGPERTCTHCTPWASSAGAIHNYDDRSDRYVISHKELFLGHFNYALRNRRFDVTVTDDSGATATATQTVTVGAVGPAAPANLRKSKSGKSGKLRYMDMAWDRRDGATNYEVRLSCVKCAEVISGQGTGTTLRITGLSATAQDYDAQIRAVNSTGTWGDWSAPVRVKS